MSDCGVVVPTLGDRPHFLEQSLRSIRSSGDVEIVVVRPPTAASIDAVIAPFVDRVVEDPMRGLAAAINFGVAALGSSVEFASWLGDDDRLTDGSLSRARRVLGSRPRATLVYGQCRYIDADNRELFVNASGRYASLLMLCGPQLVPQPGSLFRRSSFEKVGRLDEGLKWAFDLDLFLKLRHEGELVFMRDVLSEFRWHEGSLSVGSRQGSVDEASKVRRRHLPRTLRGPSAVWEPALRQLILFAGTRVSRRVEVGNKSGK